MAYNWTYGAHPNGYIYSAAVNEMRSKINLERNRRGKGTYNFVQPVDVGNKITNEVLDEIRTASIGIRPNFTPSPAPSDATKFFDVFMAEMKTHLNNLNNEAQSVAYKQVPVVGYNYSDWQYSRETPLYYCVRTEGGLLPGWSFMFNGTATGMMLPGADGIADGYYFVIHRTYNGNGNVSSTNNQIIYSVGPLVTQESGSDKVGAWTNYWYKIRRGIYGIIGYNTVVDYYYWP